MKNKMENSLPKTPPGAVCAQMVRCGKPACKCARGELHGPYFYRFVWENGRQRKIYVKKSELIQTLAVCEEWRRETRNRRQIRILSKQELRSFNADLQKIERLLNKHREGNSNA
jgi:hypothetical protein